MTSGSASPGYTACRGTRHGPVESASASPSCAIPGCCSPGSNLDVCTVRGGLRYRLAFLAQRFQVEIDGFADQLEDILLRLGRGHAPWQIGHIGAVVVRRL